MPERTLISAKAFCAHHHIEFSFIQLLHDAGLIELNHSDEDDLLSPEQLDALEKMVRMHYDLNINIEGIDAIYHLLQRVEAMQRELGLLKNRLRLYESS